MLSKYISKEAVYNQTSTISGHLPQVLLYLQCSQMLLLWNLAYLKKARKTSIRQTLSWITLMKIRLTSWILNRAMWMHQ